MAIAVEVLDLASAEFRAMGTDVHVLVLDGDDADLHWAKAEVDRLEGLWSRFRDESDVTRVNRGAGGWVHVAPETVDLVDAASRAWSATDGAFDPLLGAPLATLGYDRSFEQVAGAGTIGAQKQCHPQSIRHPEDLQVDRATRAVRVAVGHALDLGGLAKGWTADLVVAGLLDRGASGGCVNLGGDLAVAGRPPRESGWVVAVGHRASTVAPGVLAIRTGGVATSTTLRRRWRGPEGDLRHHLLDPRRGAPCAGPLVEATVVAGSAARAEALTKVAFVTPDHLHAVLADEGEAVLLTWADGRTEALGDRTRLHLAAECASDAR